MLPCLNEHNEIFTCICLSSSVEARIRPELRVQFMIEIIHVCRVNGINRYKLLFFFQEWLRPKLLLLFNLCPETHCAKAQVKTCKALFSKTSKYFFVFSTTPVIAAVCCFNFKDLWQNYEVVNAVIIKWFYISSYSWSHISASFFTECNRDYIVRVNLLLSSYLV